MIIQSDKAQWRHSFPIENPSGSRDRPKQSIMTMPLKEYLEQEIEFFDPIEKKIVKKSVAHFIVLKLILKALDGDMPAIKEILDRTEGKAPQVMEIEQQAISEIQVRIINTYPEPKNDQSKENL